jgi:hypothetical protein
MTAIDRALETLKASQAEILATLQLRKLQAESIIGLNPIVAPLLADHPQIKQTFESALRIRSTSLDAFYRGLFITTLSSFEGFVKLFVSALAQLKAEGVGKFSELPQKFQNQYLKRVGQVLSHIGSGAVQGIPYNFTGIREGLGKCLVDSGRPALNGEVYTLLMGNPTWERLDKAFQSLGIEKPFDQAFGSSEHMKSWGKAAWTKNLADGKSTLDKLIDDRNLIVHASSPISIVESDIIDAWDFLSAFGSALATQLPPRL